MAQPTTESGFRENTGTSKRSSTNPHAVNTGNINRGKQFSTRNLNSRSGPLPGKDFTKNYAITLKDIDTAVINHIKNIMKPVVRESGEIIKVPVLYANEERWKSVRKNGVLRDKKGSVLLPVIMIRRTEVSYNDTIQQSFKHDVSGEHIKVLRVRQWSNRNRYSNFAIKNGEDPVYETLTTGMPDFIICNYSIMLFAGYMEQMNEISELFIEHLQTYFGDSEDYKFLCTLDGSISDATEMAVDSERLVKSELGISLNGYILPEYTNKVIGSIPQLTKNLTPRKVTFTEKIET